MIEFVPAQPQHLRDVKIEDEAITKLLSDHSDTTIGGSPEILRTRARTMLLGGRPIACFGVIPMWSGVVQAWALLSHEALEHHSRALSRYVLRRLHQLEDEKGVVRIQAAVADGFLASHRWHQFLGFEVEGYMRRYGADGVGGFYLYARVRDG